VPCCSCHLVHCTQSLLLLLLVLLLLLLLVVVLQVRYVIALLRNMLVALDVAQRVLGFAHYDLK
jgi:hypothetical protein